MRVPRWVSHIGDHALAAHVISVASLVLTSVAVFCIFRVGEWMVESVNTGVPLRDPGPSNFLRAALSWGGAIVTVATAGAASYFEVRTLVRRLGGEKVRSGRR